MQICFRIIWMGLYDFFLIVAWHVAAEAYMEFPLSFCKCAYMKLIITQSSDRTMPPDDRMVAHLFRCIHNCI